MKLTLLLSVICTIALSGATSYSQQTKLSLQLKNASIEDLLTEIGKNSGFSFLYNDEVYNNSTKISLNIKDQPVTKILDLALRDQNLTYDIKDNVILIYKSSVKSGSQLQQIKVSGIVTDASTNEPLPGVNILIEGTTIGSTSGLNGEYTIEVPNANSVLLFSFVGYNTERQVLNGQASVLNVSLVPTIKSLEEVVVIGYGVSKKSDATGSVQNISSKDFNKGIISSPEQLLSGKVAGLSISSNSGEPGGQVRIRLRGGTSINAGNEPLFVIDDVPIDNTPHNPSGFSSGRNPLNSINPSDILDVTVLKDASATAIYGSRGANGVIIIRTKRGKIGERGVQSVDYSGYTSFSSIAKMYDVLNASEFKDVMNSYNKSTTFIGNSNNDWQKEIYRKAFTQSHDLSISGGAEKMSYRVGLGYQNQEGILKGTSSERMSGSVAFNQNLFDNYLEVVGNFRITKTEDYFGNNGAIGNSLTFNPTMPIMSGDPTRFGGYYEFDNQFAPSNPVALIEQNKDDASGRRNLGNIELKYKLHFFPKVSIKANLGYDYSDGIRRSYIPLQAKGNSQAQTADGEIRKESYFRNNNLFESYLEYNDTYAPIKSKVNVIFGYSYQDFLNEYSSFRATNLGSDILSYNSTSSATVFQAATTKNGNKLISFFGRVNYNLLEKYLVTFTLRKDGSSRFSENSRWGTFPSASVAWRLSEESFMTGASNLISNLKLRAGWGITGNQEIGNYQYMPTYTISDSRSLIQFGDQFINTLRPNGVDKDLKWEETTQINGGIDLGLWKGRFNASIDFYKKNTHDLLFTVAVPQPFLNTRVLTNIGEVENKGVELSIDANPVASKKVNWDVAFNVAFNKNKIIQLDNNTDPNFMGYEVGGISGGTGNNIQVLREGESVNSFYVFEHKMENGKPVYRDVNGDGSINNQDLYVDRNDDETINEKDKFIKGNSNPRATFGFSSMVNAFGFDFSFSLKASTQNYVYNNVASNNSLNNIVSQEIPRNILQSSRELGFLENQYLSSYFVEDASFIRLENITLGYNFTVPKTKIKSRFYCTGQNLLLITDYSGLDPENSGIDNNIYPRAKTFVFGLSLSF